MSGQELTRLPDSDLDVVAFRQTKEGKELAAWVQAEHSKAKGSMSSKRQQWIINMSFFYGRQWLNATGSHLPGGFADRLYVPRKPAYSRRLTVNRIRSFVRTEVSKFISQSPSATVVPATAEEEDVRAAYAGEQVWESTSSTAQYEVQFARMVWWMVITGNGFLKTYWDEGKLDRVSGQPGAICFSNITPFNLFVPDLREQEIEEQPYVLNAYTKPVGWCKQYFADELKGVDLKASTTSANEIVDSGYLNLSSATEPDSCMVYEMWVKPGGHRLLPNGGILISVDNTLVRAYTEGMYYQHGEYPFTKFEHIPTSTFYADSPLNDLIELQKEYNQIRSEISEAGRRMARPQLIAMQGSIIPAKLTNEPGSVILYRPGTAAPQPIQLSPLPEYYVEQQDRILADFDDISGQHDVSKGQAPAGVTAGTAINFLLEQDNSYLTPQYNSIEQGTEKVARQTLQLFNQYVDAPRKIKTIGADESFDTLLLQGSDIGGGLDIRIEKGTSVSQSQAAKQAQVTQMFAVGLITQEQALGLMELGGPQRVLDYVSAAKKKAQRENIRMKLLTDAQIQQHDMLYQMAQASGDGPTQDPTTQDYVGDPVTGDPAALANTNLVGPGGPGPQGPGPVVPVDDFDEHQIHIQVHNIFRMSQEYETLSTAVKQQFDLHVKLHQQALTKASLQQFLSQIPSDGTDQGSSANPQEQQSARAQLLAGNGAAPQAAPDETGASLA